MANSWHKDDGKFSGSSDATQFSRDGVKYRVQRSTGMPSGFKSAAEELRGAIETDEACKTPGEKKRSKGKGRGLARGGGKGPIGGQGQGPQDGRGPRMREELVQEAALEKDIKKVLSDWSVMQVLAQLYDELMAKSRGSAEKADQDDYREIASKVGDAFKVAEKKRL